MIFIADGGISYDGPYNPDARWRRCMPKDIWLRRILAWQWAKEGVHWDPIKGVIGPLGKPVKLEDDADALADRLNVSLVLTSDKYFRP